MGTKKKIINSRSYPAGNEGERNFFSCAACRIYDSTVSLNLVVFSKIHLLSRFSYSYPGLLKTVNVQHSVLICSNDQRPWMELKSVPDAA